MLIPIIRTTAQHNCNSCNKVESAGLLIGTAFICKQCMKQLIDWTDKHRLEIVNL